MKSKISAKIIADSINKNGDRLTHLYTKIPKIHSCGIKYP